jgi:hypothetical protein
LLKVHLLNKNLPRTLDNVLLIYLHVWAAQTDLYSITKIFAAKFFPGLEISAPGDTV